MNLGFLRINLCIHIATSLGTSEVKDPLNLKTDMVQSSLTIVNMLDRPKKSYWYFSADTRTFCRKACNLKQWKTIFSFLHDSPPTKFESKIVSPLLLPPPKFHNLVPPFLWFPPLLYNIQVPPSKIFNLCITGLHKLTTNTLSTCVISCDTQEQKQVEVNLHNSNIKTNTFSSQSYTQLQENAN